ncbi:methyltransferase [Vibrio astriarenae]|uniref:Methyltransferase n=1 Tax=Vibrio astriarenae TaxID=1481923 RepID=A0A7Z2T7M8_9VIBR|nr:methyltransferase [Vibrio astriarenae]QIA65755.1 methyltransferase [Vibrio astriarenae]
MQQQFTHIDRWLVKHQKYWRIEPFLFVCNQHDALPNLPSQILEWLDSLQPSDITDFKQNPESLQNTLFELVPSLFDASIIEPEYQYAAVPPSLDSHLYAGIPGRKLTQINAMSAVCLDGEHGLPWLEWCSGKGYLGRILATVSNRAVTSLEYQEQLCVDGQSLADKLNLPMNFVHGDALSAQAQSLCYSEQHAVALHACGDLHVTLIKNAALAGTKALTIAPCCYHLIGDDHYQPLSTAAKASELKLSKSDLRIPLQETVTGGERVHRHRQLEMTYRLAFQHLIGQELGLTDYLPIPSIKKSLLAEGFEAFCFWAAEKKALSLPAVDFGYYQSMGEMSFWRMEALSLLPQIFRRPLERWLVLDRALYLTEKGYEVTVGTFCERQATPRNLIIRADLRKQTGVPLKG